MIESARYVMVQVFLTHQCNEMPFQLTVSDHLVSDTRGTSMKERRGLNCAESAKITDWITRQVSSEHVAVVLVSVR